MRGASPLVALWLAAPALGDSLVAARNLPAETLVMAEDLLLVTDHIPGALRNFNAAIGLETRVAIYAGRPVSEGDLRAPTVIERNARVALEYRSGALVIRAEGRALARAAAGDWLRVMNLTSKTIVTGQVSADGLVQVGDLP